MNHTIKKLAGFNIIGMQIQCEDNHAIPQLWESFNKRSKEFKPKAVKPITAYGVCSDFDMKNNSFTYTAGLKVKDISNIPSGMITMEIPAQEYAVFECTLPTIMETMNNIFQEWLPKSDYQRADGPEFEFYDTDFDPKKPESKLYIHIPVTK